MIMTTDHDRLITLGKLAEQLAESPNANVRAVAGIVFSALGAYAAGEVIALRNMVVLEHTTPMLARIGAAKAVESGRVN